MRRNSQYNKRKKQTNPYSDDLNERIFHNIPYSGPMPLNNCTLCDQTEQPTITPAHMREEQSMSPYLLQPQFTRYRPPDRSIPSLPHHHHDHNMKRKKKRTRRLMKQHNPCLRRRPLLQPEYQR